MEQDHTERGPLRAVILAKSGEDVRKCNACWHCEQELEHGMDISLGEIIRAAAQNDPAALQNDSLWNCDPVLESNPICPSGLDRLAVIHALRDEAMTRGCNRED